MENQSEFDHSDPRQEALETAAFTAWKFAAAFQGLKLDKDEEAVRPPDADEWQWASGLIYAFDIDGSEVEELAGSYFHEALETLYPDGELEFFQKARQVAIRTNRYRKARFAIKGAVRKRLLL